MQLSLPGSRVPDKVRCLWKTFNYNDSLHLAIGQITRPPNKSLYLSMALCVDHLVGGGDPIYAYIYMHNAAVFSSDTYEESPSSLQKEALYQQLQQ